MAYGFNEDKSKVELTYHTDSDFGIRQIKDLSNAMIIPNNFTLDPTQTGKYTVFNVSKAMNSASIAIMEEWKKHTLFAVDMSSAGSIGYSDTIVLTNNEGNRNYAHQGIGVDWTSSGIYVFAYSLALTDSGSGILNANMSVQNINVPDSKSMRFNMAPLLFKKV